MRFVLVALLMLSSTSALARWPRRPCATAGMSCTPGPCCRGTKCGDLNMCQKPEDEWKRTEPGPDDTAETRKKRAEQNAKKK